MSEIEETHHSDDEVVNPKAHKRLLDGISNLAKTQHIKKPERSEPSLAQDEFHLVKNKLQNVKDRTSSVSVGDIVSVLKKTQKHLSVGKELRKTQPSKKVLKKPLEKPVAERIQRSIGYEKIKKQLSRWDAIVSRNRLSDHQVFPLNHGESIRIKFKSNKAPKLSIKNNLMIELDEIDAQLKEIKTSGKTCKANENDNEDNEKRIQEKLTRDELNARRKELAYLRMRESQKSAKARLKNKIKSKKYHKILKREKLKEQIKEFEILQKINPEAALEKLEKLEKNRVLERASLRHKNTGTWAKNLQIRAKYDKEVRKDLAEQLAISRELTQKTNLDDDDEDEVDKQEEEDKLQDNENNDPFNPWTKNQKIPNEKNEVDELLNGYRKYWMERNKNEKDLENYKSDLKQTNETNKLGKNEFHEEKNKKILPKKLKSIKKSTSKKLKSSIGEWIEEEIEANDIINDVEMKRQPRDIDDIFDEAEDALQEKLSFKMKEIGKKLKSTKNKVRIIYRKDELKNLRDLSFKNKIDRPDLDEELIEQPVKQMDTEILLEKSPNSNLNLQSMVKTSEIIDPMDYSKVKPKILNTSLPDALSAEDVFEDEENNEDNKHQMTIAEAFEDDDLFADFEKEKDEEKKNLVDELDLTLPGWGSWAGCGISKEKRQKRLVLKFPKDAPRRDENKGHLYINENADRKKIKEHLVSDLPFPFTSVKDFEASIRAPTGRTFVPETAFRVLTRPSVVTKKGHIIEPMDESYLNKPPKKPRTDIDKRIALITEED